MTDNNRKGDEFVQALQGFHAGLAPEQQAMLQRIISAATLDETSGYARMHRTEDTASTGRMQRNESDETTDDTSGYGSRTSRTEDAPSTTGTDSIDQWAKLVEWLNQADDDTSGYARAV